MITTNLLVVFALFSVFVHVATSIMIMSEMIKRGEKINFIFIKIFIIKYAHQFKKITESENVDGKANSLFYWWRNSAFLALIFAMIALLTK